MLNVPKRTDHIARERRKVQHDRLGDLAPPAGSPPPVAGILVGREGDIEEVLELLSRSRVVTLTGAPGVGKSTLAFEVARRVERPEGPGSVTVSLGSVVDPDEVAPAVAHAVGSRLWATEPAEAGGVVILDDCDAGVETCAEVAQALVGHGLRVLATCREPLSAQGEAVWRVPALSLPAVGGGDVEGVLRDSEAVRLFCDRASSADRRFAPSAENIEAIAQICRRLDGIPLAIELAARCVMTCSPADIAARLDEPFSLLTVAPRTAQSRHRNLWAALAWSYDNLSVAECMLLERLAVFGGAFSAGAAAQVCGDDELGDAEVSDILRSLVEKSLVEVDTAKEGTRYRLLEMVRRFAADKLLSTGEEDLLRRRHAAWCAAALKRAGDPRRARTWLERLRPYHDDVHVALEWALRVGRADTAVVLGQADVALCRAQGRHSDARTGLERVVAAAADAGPGLRAEALGEAGAAETLACELPSAVAHLEEAVAGSAEAGEPEEEIRSQLALGFAKMLAGDHAVAMADLEVAAGRSRGAKDPSLLVDALASLGRVRLLVGEPNAALALFTESVGVARRHDDQVGEAQGLVGIGAAEVALGHYEVADAALGEGLHAARDLGELHRAAMASVWLGESARRRGQAALAERRFTEAAEMAQRAYHPYSSTLALLGLGRVALANGDLIAAREHFEGALTTARASSVPYLLAGCLCSLAEVTDDPAKARTMVDEALAAAQRCGDKAGQALALASSADLSRADGDVGRVTSEHLQALLLWAHVGDPWAIANSLAALAALAAERRDFSVAARLLGAVHSVRDRHHCVQAPAAPDEAASAAEAARQALGDDSFAAEWRNGTSLSIEGAVAYAAGHQGRRPKRPSKGWDALTYSERRVAELAAQGYTNSDISRAFNITASTVKAHLRKVYAKMGVGNRASLATEVHRQHGA